MSVAMRSSAVLLVTLLVSAVLGFAPAAAQGADGLIAFENRYDEVNNIDRIEVMRPDGSDRRVLVDDAASAAVSPDGERVAFIRTGDVYVADVATGEETLVSSDARASNHPAWSPDGSLLAFRRGAPAGEDCTHLQNAEIFVTDLTAERQLTFTECLTEDHPDFSPDGTRLVFSNFYVNANFTSSVTFLTVADLQTGDATDITAPGEGHTSDPAWSPDGSRIAYAGLYEVFTIPAGGGEATGVTSTSESCNASDEPEWSPDGSRILFTLICEDQVDLAVTPAAGGAVEVLTGADGDESNASWAGTAQTPGPGPTPPPTGGGGSMPPSPDEPLIELVDGARVDGGGSGDPVGQAIATSQSIWADGGAPLVVLATAENFPDALAGSALAGELGPILVTPFGPDLEPRVEAEIDRVTGGDGMVLILGGVNAVTETAAQQARQAAGATSCEAPFPSDCRYAGTGREHTAALVGETVLALNDGSGGRALLARGDAFADAITGGAYAAEAGVPILLTPSGSLNTTTEQFIRDNGVAEVIVLGGTAAVSDAAVAAVPAQTRRVAGDDRTATSAAIATELWQAEGLSGGGIVLVNVRNEQGWQAALAAAVVSALANAPQLGVENPPGGPLNPSAAVLDAAAALGGPVETHASTGLVSDEQLDAVRDAAA